MHRSGLFCLVLLLTSACQRRAPGPDACVKFAARAVALQHPSRRHAAEVEARFQEVTRRCLTTPYDYELLNCHARGGQLRACALSFEARTARSSDLF